MIKILFVCIHNSARSQMAEAFLNSLKKYLDLHKEVCYILHKEVKGVRYAY